MMFTSDLFTPHDRSTPEEAIDQTSRYRQDTKETPDQPQTSQTSPKKLQSSEPQKHRQRRRKPTGRKISRSRTSVNNSNFNNEYSAIVSLGFTLIKFLFLFVAGFVIAYVFASVAHQPTAEIIWKVGSMLIMPLVGLVFCIVAGVIILESCRG